MYVRRRDSQCHYRSLHALERRRAAAHYLANLTSSASTESERAALEEVVEALNLLDANITAPILCHTRARVEASERLLARKTGRKKNEFLIGAWTVATVEKLIWEGWIPTKAVSHVAEAAGVSDSTIEHWRRKWRRDDAPLIPRHSLDAGYFLRLSYRVWLIHHYVGTRAITGEMMCRYFKDEPELVSRLSVGERR
jgi:hypothetical protein